MNILDLGGGFAFDIANVVNDFLKHYFSNENGFKFICRTRKILLQKKKRMEMKKWII